VKVAGMEPEIWFVDKDKLYESDSLLRPRAGRERTNGATSRILALSSPYDVWWFSLLLSFVINS
jgi:hypothetical protein